MIDFSGGPFSKRYMLFEGTLGEGTLTAVDPADEPRVVMMIGRVFDGDLVRRP